MKLKRAPKSVLKLPDLEQSKSAVRKLCHTGKLQWVFHSIPKEGELGSRDLEGRFLEDDGGMDVWTMMSAGEALVYEHKTPDRCIDRHRTRAKTLLHLAIIKGL